MRSRPQKKTKRAAPRRDAAGGLVSSWERTDVGRKREKNEDSYLVDANLMFYAVADGMGGHAGGETASRLAVEVLRDSIRTAYREGKLLPPPPAPVDADAVLQFLQRAISRASLIIHDAAARDTTLSGMGTTVTLVLFHGRRAYVAHVGDSRLYRWRNQVFELLTEDHSLVNEQIKAGFITAEEAQFSRFRNIITRSVGFESQVTADTFSLGVQTHDVFLICSDGLTGMVEDAEIAEVLKRRRLADCAQELVTRANRHGGEDNITLVLLEYRGVAGRPRGRKPRKTRRKRK